MQQVNFFIKPISVSAWVNLTCLLPNSMTELQEVGRSNSCRCFCQQAIGAAKKEPGKLQFVTWRVHSSRTSSSGNSCCPPKTQLPQSQLLPGSPDPRIPVYWEPCVAHSPRHVRIQMEAVKWRRTPLLLLLRFVWLKQMAFWPAASLGCHISIAHRPGVPTKKPRSEG